MLFDKNLTPHISVWGWSLTLFSRAFGRPTVVPACEWNRRVWPSPQI